MTVEDILKNSFVITNGGIRLEQFKRTFDAVGLNSSLIREWRACMIPGEGILGHAVAMYSCVRYAQEQKMPFVLVFEDDVVPSDNAKEELLKAFENKPKDCVCLSLGWSYDSDPQPDKEFSLRSDRRRVYGLNAVVLFGNEGYETFLKEWEKNGRSDIVVSNFAGSYMTNKSHFTQHTIGQSMNLPAGWTVDKKLEEIVDKEAAVKYRKAEQEIAKIKAENTIHVAYTVDVNGLGSQQFCDQLLVSIFSLKTTMKMGERIHIHVFYGNFPAEKITNILHLSSDNFIISFEKLGNSFLSVLQSYSKQSRISTVRTFPGIVFARFWLSKLLNPAIKKCIYLDADTMALFPISELWNIDIGDNLIGAPKGIVPEYGFYSGTIILNLDGFRKEKTHTVEAFGKYCEVESSKFYLPDQTAMNRFFVGKIFEISDSWIFPPTPGEHKKELKNCKMWHFYNPPKPTRIDSDDSGTALLAWNTMLNAAEREIFARKIADQNK